MQPLGVVLVQRLVSMIVMGEKRVRETGIRHGCVQVSGRQLIRRSHPTVLLQKMRTLIGAVIDGVGSVMENRSIAGQSLPVMSRVILIERGVGLRPRSGCPQLVTGERLMVMLRRSKVPVGTDGSRLDSVAEATVVERLSHVNRRRTERVSMMNRGTADLPSSKSADMVAASTEATHVSATDMSATHVTATRVTATHVTTARVTATRVTTTASSAVSVTRFDARQPNNRCCHYNTQSQPTIVNHDQTPVTKGRT